MSIKSTSVFIMVITCCYSVCIPTLPDNGIILTYAGKIVGIGGGFNCGTMSDAEMDQKLDDACNAQYPGSRNLRGVELENNEWQKIVNLPTYPAHTFAPSCECAQGCGETCDAPGNGRLCMFAVQGTWDINAAGPDWVVGHSSAVLTAECVYETPGCVLPDPNIALKYAGVVRAIDGNSGFSCSAMTDDEMDAKLDKHCDLNYPGSRNIRGVELENNGWQNIIDLPTYPAHTFAPSCECAQGCGETCDAPGNGRLCMFGVQGPWDINDGPPDWVVGHSSAVLTAECVYPIDCERAKLGNKCEGDSDCPGCMKCCKGRRICHYKSEFQTA